MDTRDLSIFSAAYESSSFSQAANQLYMSPQGVSKSITKLENELGVKLFKRTTKGIAPTKPAHRLYEKATDLRVTFQSITMTRSDNNVHQEMVNLFIADDFSSYLGFDFFNDFQNKYSNKTLNFVEFPDSMLTSALMGHGNIGFIEGPIDFDQFSGFYITTNHYVAILSPNHPLANNPMINIQNLNHESLATKSKEFKIFNLHLSELVKHKVFPIHTIQTSNNDFIVEFAKRGLGVGIVPDYLLQLPHFKDLVATNQVVARPLDGATLKRDVYFVQVNGKQLTEGERLFKAYVQEFFN
ncbi:LysR family transcriptional regulator [Lactiplantibacillus plantarum]|uniref:LysR family transcriptional regulator n=1 Tax=Lactiplantibacillus plantarum TaxID=1590 RepID=UPI0007E4CC25|nr:LysR family transcriptional regulator [Lactiplantibacillus plantarum]ANJ15460.1 hypothetical protein A8704_15425 [Lactiplantibacillus plantarum]MBP5818522.1 LysR family transcriptional regulator [Lactiplantibacillus plantarum]